MSILSRVSTNHEKPPLLLIHGQPKVGKTTFAASAPNPIVLATEQGLGRTEQLRNVPALAVGDWPTVVEAMQALHQDGARTYRTIIIDSLDHLEPHIHAVIAQRNGKKDIADIGYGKGFIEAATMWRNEFLPWIEALRRSGYMVVMIAHSQAVKESPPDLMTTITRWSLKVHKDAAAILCEVSDVIGYASIPVMTAGDAAPKGQISAPQKIVGIGDRRLYLQPGGGFLAGSRYRTPEWVPLDWAQLAPYLSSIPAPIAPASHTAAA